MRSSSLTTLTLLFLFAFVLRLIAIAVTGPATIAFGDANDYIHTATQLCDSGSYPDRGSLPFFRAPGLPFFISAVTLCNPSNVSRIKYALAAVDSLNVVLIALLAMILFESRVTTCFAGLGALCHPLFVAAVCDIRTEPLFMFLMTLSLTCVFASARRARRRTYLLLAIVSGIVLSLAALTRPVALVLVPLFTMTQFLLGRPAKSEVPRATAFILGVSITLSPWVIRNGVRYGELIVVNDAGGYNFWRGSHPEMSRIAGIRGRAAYLHAGEAFEQTSAAMAARIDMAHRSFRARSRAWFQEGLRNIEADRGGAARFAMRKAAVFWRPWLNPQEFRWQTVLFSGLILSLLEILAAAQLVSMRTNRRPLVLWIILFFVILWLTHIPYQVVMRFRVPFTDPLLIVLASACLGGWIEQKRLGFKRTQIGVRSR